MEALTKFLMGALTAIATLFFLRLLGPLAGALAGWIVGLFFADTIFAVLRGFGVSTGLFSMWQLGLTLSFLGSFFTPVIHRNQ